MTPAEILDRLIAFPSVVGTPNGEIVAWIADYLEKIGAKVTLIPGPEGDRSNLFATLGPADRPGYIVSGHMDVVPAGEPDWSSDPFAMRRDGDHLFGRGTSDMKGFLATVLAAAPEFAKRELKHPIHIAFSYDEEAGCRGVPHMIAKIPDLCAKPLGAIIGEPSGMRAVRAHKGKAAARITVKGLAGHSSRPDLGRNAIHAMANVLNATITQAANLATGPFDDAFQPPYSSMQAGIISGGQALNIIPEEAVMQVEARAITGVDPAGLLTQVKEAAEALAKDGFEVEWTELNAYPALSLAADAPLATLVEELSGNESLAAVSYGTEAGLFQQAGIDAIICGPGDIGRAHKPDEYVLISELEACLSMIRALGDHCAA
ncbi:acetylornithine deacetylase [Rhizobium sp. NRK18]|uniref:acetylornithine deacetylase n=1 Tax=Rhizobium sp. NRK18 TaxID=2964667 RepID=UPI0021C3B6A7|nr:acetylornithine deacetylase [Rhizobium sp. NRK18]MCQ2003331.1 acetylornithine deacetylase [Rhizobium sp. NRK18]